MTREQLPQRRGSDWFAFDHEEAHYVCCYSRYPDGRLAEVFLDVLPPTKVGSSLDCACKDLGVLVSIALQSGVSEGDIRSALTQELDGTMRGPLGVALRTIAADREGEAA